MSVIALSEEGREGEESGSGAENRAGREGLGEWRAMGRGSERASSAIMS